MKPTTLEKHFEVVDQYLTNGKNWTKAYMHVYPDIGTEGAATNAQKILRNTKVSEYLEKRKNEIRELKEKEYKDKIASDLELQARLSEASRGKFKPEDTTYGFGREYTLEPKEAIAATEALLKIKQKDRDTAIKIEQLKEKRENADLWTIINQLMGMLNDEQARKFNEWYKQQPFEY